MDIYPANTNRVRWNNKKTTQNAKGEPEKMAQCGEKTEIYSRVCGYFRPVSNWNQGKREEFKDRKEYEVPAKKDCK